jgi:membrane associated rhomboid family serine protease
VLALLFGFGLELATDSAGNDAALLRLGALPDNGRLGGEYWRFVTYSFLHFNWAHLVVNAILLLWVGRIVERRIGTGRFGAIYFFSALTSATSILLFHYWHPKMGATVGASGSIFGLFGAALVISYLKQWVSFERLRLWLWIALFVGFGVSLLPDISMSGHIGGLIGGSCLALVMPRPN